MTTLKYVFNDRNQWKVPVSDEALIIMWKYSRLTPNTLQLKCLWSNVYDVEVLWHQISSLSTRGLSNQRTFAHSMSIIKSICIESFVISE